MQICDQYLHDPDFSKQKLSYGKDENDKFTQDEEERINLAIEWARENRDELRYVVERGYYADSEFPASPSSIAIHIREDFHTSISSSIVPALTRICTEVFKDTKELHYKMKKSALDSHLELSDEQHKAILEACREN